MNINYDICIVCLNYIKNDARSLNLANTLVKLGKKVAVISLKDDYLANFSFDSYQVDIDSSERLYKKMLRFTLNVRRNFLNLKSAYYLASELYSLPATRLIQKKNNGLLIYDSREIFSAIGNTHNQAFKQLFFTKLEQYLVKSVDSVIVSGHLDAEYLRSIFPKNLKYSVIMNVPNYKESFESDLLREQFSIPENLKIILYQGMIMQGRGIEIAIRAMKQLDDYALVIMGDGEDMLEYYKNLSNEIGVCDKVFFKSFVPYNELHQWTCSADVGLALFEPLSLSYKLALPNKLFEYAMAGIPSIATNLPAIADVVKDYPISYLVDYPFNLNNIVDSIKLASNPTNYQNYVNSAESASKFYNYENQIKEIKKVFEIQ